MIGLGMTCSHSFAGEFERGKYLCRNCGADFFTKTPAAEERGPKLYINPGDQPFIDAIRRRQARPSKKDPK